MFCGGYVLVLVLVSEFISGRNLASLLIWAIYAILHGGNIPLIVKTWIYLSIKELLAPGAQSPFFVGGIHLIPWHADRVSVVFGVAHQESDPLANQPARCDAHWPGLEKSVHGSFFGESDPLALLASYIVERYVQSASERKSLSSLAELLIGEIARAVHRPNRPKAAARGVRVLHGRRDGHPLHCPPRRGAGTLPYLPCKPLLSGLAEGLASGAYEAIVYYMKSGLFSRS
jgi:hypothetical protein